VEGFADTNTFYTSDADLTQRLTNLLGTNSHKIETSPIPGLKKQDDICKLATEPKYIPSRNPNSEYNCGWLFNDDDETDYKESYGHLGTESGPVDQLKTNSGQYIWNLKEAQKMEDAKICKRISICELVDLKPQTCGFCPSLGYGIPINSKGQNLYTNTLGLTCPENPITNSNKCPRPFPKSYADEIYERLPCDPDPLTGKLSNECLLRIAKAFGFPESGPLIRILQGDLDGYMKSGTDANFKLNKAKDILMEDLRMKPNDAYFGKGVCLRTDLVNYYNSLKNALYQKKSEKAQKAAGFIIRNEPFDPCYKRPDESGPFDLICIQRLALMNNFTQTGLKFPKTEDDLDKFEDNHWAYVQDYYKRRGNLIYSTDVKVKKQAFLDNYGIKLE